MSTADNSQAAILARMLSRVPDDLDKREGSIIYDALAPAAFELSWAWRVLGDAYRETFVLYAEGDSLDLRVGEIGISRLPATKAVRKATFTDDTGAALDISIGDRFTTMDAAQSQNFIATERIEAGTWTLEAETPGTAANNYIGVLSPISTISGLAAATMVDAAIIKGEDAETDDELRTRYFDYVKADVADGNVAQYEHWAAEFSGVGRAKVFPAWDGVNTVKVSILDSDQEPASATLIAAFQEFLDPDSGGVGNGAAPIGAVVTVSTATAVTVNIAATYVLAPGHTSTEAEAAIEASLEAFFADIAYQQDAVYLIAVGAAILGTAGVKSVSAVSLNTGTADISLGDEQIGALGTLTLTEAT